MLDRRKGKISAPNGGLIYFSRELIEYDISSSIAYNILNEVLQLCSQSYDELVFSVICHKKNIPYEELSIMYNCWHFYSDAHNAYIIHPNGKEKFWNNKLIGTAYSEWHVNNKIYNRSIGKDYYPSNSYSYSQLDQYIGEKLEIRNTLQLIESRLQNIEKGVFPFKRLCKHLRTAWKKLFHC